MMHGTAQQQLRHGRDADTICPANVQNLRFAAGGQTLLHDVDLVLERAGTTVIMGPNGAGKSLLLRLLHGLLTPTAGDVRWNGRAPDRAVRRRQAMVFQKPVLLRRSAIANVTYALKVRGVPRVKRRDLAARALAEAGLTALARRPARVLSSGEQQRLALARAWATRPEVLFLDEPTANLDLGWREQIVRTIDQLYAETGVTVLLVCHELEVLPTSCERVVLLRDGRVVADAEPREVLTTASVADLYGRGLNVMECDGRWAVVPGGKRHAP